MSNVIVIDEKGEVYTSYNGEFSIETNGDAITLPRYVKGKLSANVAMKKNGTFAISLDFARRISSRQGYFAGGYKVVIVKLWGITFNYKIQADYAHVCVEAFVNAINAQVRDSVDGYESMVKAYVKYADVWGNTMLSDRVTVMLGDSKLLVNGVEIDTFPDFLRVTNLLNKMGLGVGEHVIQLSGKAINLLTERQVYDTLKAVM